MIKLSVIVPYHNEPQEKIYPTFNCLNNQNDIPKDDVEVLVINNAQEPTFPSILTDNTFSNLSIRCYTNPNYPDNIGMACQKGIEEAKGDYILFIDSDDLLIDNNCLNDCLSALSDYPTIDVIIFKDTAAIANGNLFLVTEDYVFRSAKLYRKEFLIENKISHIPELKLSEDTLLNLMIDLHNPTKLKIDRLLSIHTYNKDSVTRASFVEYIDKASLDFIKGIDIISQMGYNKDEHTQETLNKYIDNFGQRMAASLGNQQPNILTAVCKYLVEKNINKKDE